MLMTVSFAFADGESEEIEREFDSVVDTLVNIGMVLCFLGLAVSGIQMLLTDSNNAAKVQKRVITMILALAVLFILKTLMGVGKTLFIGGGGWEPPA